MAALPRFTRLAPERQRALLRAAREEFVMHGFEQASMNRIVERAGVSKGAMYYYFEGKEDLFVTTLERSLRGMRDAIGVLEPEVLTAESFWRECMALTTRWTEYVLARPLDVQLWRLVSHERFSWPKPLHGEERSECPALSGELGVLIEEQQELVRTIILRGRALGVVRVDVHAELLVELVTSIGETCDRWLFRRWDELAPEEVREHTAQHIDMVRRVLIA